MHIFYSYSAQKVASSHAKINKNFGHRFFKNLKLFEQVNLSFKMYISKATIK